jgi:hypothetical protein
MKQALMVGLIVGIVLMGTSVGLFSWSVDPAHAADVGQQGRYQIVVSPITARDMFLLDTNTGRVWQRVTFTDLKGEPTVWDLVPRLDSAAQELEYIRTQELKRARTPGN